MSFSISPNSNSMNYLNPMRESTLLIGRDSLRITNLVSNIFEENNRSIFLGWRSDLKSQIADLVKNYGDLGWDGEDAEPILARVASAANIVVDSLPNHIAVPEITPDISGHISIDWNTGKNKIMSIVVSEESIIFAAIVGSKKYHGELPFTYELPREIEDILSIYFKSN